MISISTVRKAEIRLHYDLATPFYWLLWGRHLHHGYWDANETVEVATQRLTDELVARAQLQPGHEVLDIGCGMGGSSISLALGQQCRVTGVTLSPLQRAWATASARWRGASDRVRFLRADAEEVEFPPESFDRLWSIECTEHLFDKPRFFQRAAQWLRPGGRFVLCAWLAGEPPLTDPQRILVETVCDRFLCPSFGTMSDYANWLTSAGLVVEETSDWTPKVDRTWELCVDRVRSSGVRGLTRVFHNQTDQFVAHFQTLLDAYRTGAMSYGCLVASKPATAEGRS